MKFRTTQLEESLESIRIERTKGKYEDGMFGFKECKESIKWNQKYLHKSLQHQYAEFVSRALTEIGFNIFMIVACEELMDEEFK